MNDNRREDMLTRSSLLLRLKDKGDHRSWQRFFDTYGSLIYGVAMREGLRHVEAQEVVQETMAKLSERIEDFTYDRSKGSFRSWLLKMVHWKICDQFRKRNASRETSIEDADEAGRGGAVPATPDPRSELASRIDQAWARSLIAMATDAVKGKVSAADYQIYDLYVFQEKTADEVSEILGVSKSKIYMVKLRVGRVFNSEARHIQRKLERHG